MAEPTCVPAKYCCQVPLTERLRSVPELARVLVEDPSCHGTRSIPVGEYCQKAADEIESLRINFSQQRTEISQLKTVNLNIQRRLDAQQLEIGRLTTECEYAKRCYPTCADPLGFYLYRNADGTEEYRIPKHVLYPSPQKESCRTQPDIRADRPS